MSKAKDLIKELGSKQAATDTLSRNENNDCVVRAVQHAFKVDYVDAHHFCETKLNRVSGQGTYTGRYLGKVTQAFGKRINKMGRGGRLTRAKKTKVEKWSNAKQRFTSRRQKVQVRYQVKEFVKEFNQGSYIVIVNAHAFALVDGKIIGNWDDDRRLNREVRSAYKVK
jgi:phosphopentomutase